ncbi:MAG: flavodoxin-dependent (E)-4-hydroxy-3-methylbut-2-enyl-diphosphate synthase [Coriobacteriales bacterium]|jgi:(E)-4-hydroxy-3-methylbut-2-enyl-diphosphate synthase
MVSSSDFAGSTSDSNVGTASGSKACEASTSKTDVAPRSLTKQVMVGEVPVGGGAPVAVQTMLSTPTTDVELALSQISKVRELGCEIVRLAVPNSDALEPFGRICEASPLPVVADIHFDYKLAIGAIERGASKIRINPGNIGSEEKVDAVIDAAGQAGIPIRIGVNGGSLEQKYRDMQGMTLAQKLAASAEGFVEHFESRGFSNVVVSAKAHDVPTTVDTYRELSRSMPHIPLHIGVTEAGTLRQGTVKSAVGLGILLAEGIGDTMRVSLTAGIEEEVLVAWEILASLGLRRRTPELVSCPTCGRTQIDLISIASEVEKRLEKIEKPIKVAVMGCVVNGPGEAADADIGIAGGRGSGLIFSHGEVIRKVDEEHIVEALFEEIDKL